jgi:hypothetical protein
MFGNAMFGGQDFGNMMQSTQNSFAGSIPPINIGYYNATQNNPAHSSNRWTRCSTSSTCWASSNSKWRHSNSRWTLTSTSGRCSSSISSNNQQPAAVDQQMDPMQYQQYMQQQYQQQINPQQQAMPAQQDMGMAGQLANQPLRFRNPDFYSEQRYLGFQPGGVRYQLP